MSATELQHDQTKTPDRNFQAILLLVLFIIAVTARLLPGPRTIDDAFITFRYARNILAGNGFVYNPGEHVLGTTTPLYTFLLTGLGLLTGGAKATFPVIAWLVNAIADGITCVLLYLIGKALKAPLAGLGAALVWAVAPFSVTFAIGGLETSVFVLIMVSIVYAYMNGSYRWSAFLSALALTTRPDALLFLLPLAADRCWVIIRSRPKRKNDTVAAQTPARSTRSGAGIVGEVLAFVIPLGIWLVFATIYFGSPIPHSIAAKSLAYRLPPDAAFVRLLQHYTTPFLEHLTFGMGWIGVGLVLVPFLFLVGALRILRVTQRAWPFLIYPWLYFVAYSFANPLIFRWYLTPPLPALILTMLVGMDGLLRSFQSFISRRTTEKRTGSIRIIFTAITIILVVGMPVLLSLRGWVIKPDHGLTRPAPEMAWYKLELLYRQAASRLDEEISGHAGEITIAAGDVGVLGYYTGARILDTVGLNSPQSLHYYPLEPSYYEINYAIPPDLILDNQPEYIVILEVYGRRGLLKDPRFQDSYRLVEKIPTDIYGSDGMLIFKRVNQ
jgi:arabinofuranosyltransferase